MPQQLPRVLVGVFGALALVTSLTGLLLEWRYLELLQRHPYGVNLLSGMTGFSVSALLVTVVVQRVLAAERRKRWRSAAISAATGMQAEITTIHRMFTPETVARSPVAEAALMSDPVLRCDALRNLATKCQAATARRDMFPVPVDDRLYERLAASVSTILDHWWPLLADALDLAQVPELVLAVSWMRRDLVAQGVHPADQATNVIVRLSWLVAVIVNQPSYRSYVRATPAYLRC